MHSGVRDKASGSERMGACRYEAAVRIRAAMRCLGPPEDWIDIEPERVHAALDHLARAVFWTDEATRP